MLSTGGDKKMNLYNFLLKTLFAGSFAVMNLASAQTWPTKAVTFVNAFPAGASSDVLGRVVAEKVKTILGQPVIVENRAGSNGLIAGNFVVHAPADGYTILQPSMGMLAISPSLYSNMPFDVQKDLAPIIQLASLYNLLVIHPDLPVKTVEDLIKLAKEQPGKLSFASAGNGSSQHIAGELFKVKAGVNMLHVPYKGGAPALIDLTAGRVSMMFGNLPELMSYVKSGKLRAIAFGSATSSPLLPDVPTISKVIPGFEIPNWYGVSAPAGTPPAIIRRLNEAFQKALEAPEVRDKLLGLGFETRGGTPEAFAKVIADDTARWAPLIKSSQAKVE
jgi:tripartite-type tricarboxylate transporter receptor subunit TctC